MTELVTIVIPTRDRPALADRAIESALSQTHKALEVIVVDDGSKQPFRPSTTDSRVRLIRHDLARGTCAARNLGLSQARGTWISFLDDDDALLPRMIETSVWAAMTSQLDRPVAVLSALAVSNSDLTAQRIRRPVTLARGAHYFLESPQHGASFQSHNSLVAPTELVRSIGGWDERLRSSEHDDFFLRLNAVCSIQGIDDVMYLLLDHGLPRLHSAHELRAQAMELTLNKHDDIFRQHPAKRGHYLATIGLTYLRGGRWWPAIRFTSLALVSGAPKPRFIFWWLASLAGPHVFASYRVVHSMIMKAGERLPRQRKRTR